MPVRHPRVECYDVLALPKVAAVPVRFVGSGAAGERNGRPPLARLDTRCRLVRLTVGALRWAERPNAAGP